MVQRYLELGQKSFVASVKNQMIELLQSEMAIGLHLHPIWMTAQLVDGSWKFHDSDYMLSAFPLEKIKTMIKDGCDFISGCKKEALGEGRCISFRGGGYCFSPEKTIFRELRRNGILVDSSVNKYSYLRSYNQKFNYRNTPEKFYWKFNDESGICSEASEGILELPITSVNQIPFKWTLYREHKLDRPPLKGKPSNLLYKNDLERFLDKYERKFDGAVTLSVDDMHYLSMIKLIEYYVKLFEGEHQCVVMIGHPKFQSVETIINLEKFINEVKSRFKVRFITVEEAYNEYV